MGISAVQDTHLKNLVVPNTPLARQMIQAVDELVIRVRQAKVADLSDDVARVHYAVPAQEVRKLLAQVSDATETKSATVTDKTFLDVIREQPWTMVACAYVDSTLQVTPIGYSRFPSLYASSTLLAALNNYLSSWVRTSYVWSGMLLTVRIYYVSDSDIRVYCSAERAHYSSQTQGSANVDTTVAGATTDGIYSQKTVTCSAATVEDQLSALAWTIALPANAMTTTVSAGIVRYVLQSTIANFKAHIGVSQDGWYKAEYEEVLADNIPFSVSSLQSLVDVLE